MSKLLLWQGVTLATLFIGYVGYYLCRSNLAVATVLLQAPGTGLSQQDLGRAISLGVLLYALGKAVNGVLVDFVGGRRLFLGGMVASVACTMLLAGAGELPLPVLVIAFTLLWCLNRFGQSVGWASLIQISSRWFPHSTHGTVMALLSVSYLVGDATARLYLGAFERRGVGWQGLFLIAAGTLAVIALLGACVLRARPALLGLPPPPPANVFGTAEEKPAALRELLGALLGSTRFWLVCLLSLGLTLVRETFNSWSKEYLTRWAGFPPQDATQASAVFPLMGVVGTLLAGPLSDLFGGKCGRVMVPALVGLVAALLALARVPGGEGWQAFGLLGVVGFLLMLCYPLCAGVLALGLGGKRGSSTAAGLIDSSGYFGAILAGLPVTWLVELSGWPGVFEALAGLTALTLLVAVVFWARQEWAPALVVVPSSGDHS